ncbi:glycoside hydrolase family 127 protein [Lapidilactobacillus mulanensis]|uniref:Glycoside hydrolase family 127 protein n=1 Tax=Lapidilactobacillus mulanensis TaxID=2485999 RepID=A0ABW4DMS2_9LACO|nr:beta-L-arabinofuranosidase domain-containing protein [Lapidilactobacillus mulanensis]
MKITSTKITDKFWQNYRQLVKEELIPYQWSVINDEISVNIQRENANSLDAVEKSHAIQNLKIAAGLATGEFYGFWFQDSDVYKWLETVAYALRYAPDTDLQQKADDLIQLIAQAQQPDGYLDTYIQLTTPQNKFKHVSFSHELYCMGHYIEAGVAYYQTTGNQTALDIAVKMATCLDNHFGPEVGKLHGYPGHPEIELALAKLADVTGDTRFTNLAKYMIDMRGTTPNFFAEQTKTRQAENITDMFDNMDPDPQAKYFQNQAPVREMKTAEGHAVRMTYLLTGMAHIARQTHDQSLIEACQRLWNNITDRRMYITGGIGSTVSGEAFTYDYDLPNDTMYAETCASCAMTFFAKQMQELTPDRKYADLMERELFNGTISGMSLDGKHFFYVNPLSVDPVASANDPTKSHVKVQRADWFGCACCPPNLARLVASVDQYIYTVKDDTIYVDQFIGNHTTFDNGLTIDQSGNYPWQGNITLKVTATQPSQSTLAIRIPTWSQPNYQLAINGVAQSIELNNGYAKISQVWSGTTELTLTLDMSARKTQADPKVTADIGKLAVERGPLVYCLEQADNGSQLPQLALPLTASFIEKTDENSLAIPFVRLQAEGTRIKEDSDALYSTATVRSVEATELNFIPYFAWANRTAGEMEVWVAKQG